MSLIDINSIKGVRIDEPYGRNIKIILAPDISDEVKDVSITMGIIDPHSQNDLHMHPEGIEILYIVSGFGYAVIGDEKFPIRHDSLIVAPKGVMHQQVNESDDPMKMFAVWTPPVTSEEVLGRARQAQLQAGK